jgi:putative ABC transport system permease protein
MQLNKARLIDRVRTMPEARRIAYRDDRGLAIILSVVGIALMGVTAFGIIGVTSFWVTQRQRQIGIRRALGATRTAILRYFQTENLLIAATGALLGILLTVTLNVWLAGKFEVASIPFGHIAAAAAIVLTLGQLAVLWPALRAASISPAIAIRGAQVSPSAVATQ